KHFIQLWNYITNRFTPVADGVFFRIGKLRHGPAFSGDIKYRVIAETVGSFGFGQYQSFDSTFSGDCFSTVRIINGNRGTEPGTAFVLRNSGQFLQQIFITLPVIPTRLAITGRIHSRLPV